MTISAAFLSDKILMPFPNVEKQAPFQQLPLFVDQTPNLSSVCPFVRPQF